MSPLALLRRFLRFGFLAWGGPVAQIGLLRRELVDEERWIEPEPFRRVLGVYQVLPGPEATELAVHFGMVRGGRLGGLMAGLGFVLPGFLLMLGASAVYVAGLQGGGRSALLMAISAGAAPAAVVLVARGGYRIAKGALRAPALIAGAVTAAAAEALGLPFWLGLLAAALLAELAIERGAVAGWLVPPLALGLGWLAFGGEGLAPLGGVGEGPLVVAGAAPGLLSLFLIGLRGGLLTFGGAYTAVPFVRNLAVGGPGGFMSDPVFLDGFAIGALLPAPLVIFSTFVGYVGGGVPGAVATTLGMFLPAFSFTLVGFDVIHRLVETPRIHAFLDGVTAGAIGIVAITVVRLADAAFTDLVGLAAAALAALVVFGWKSPWATPAAVLAGSVLGVAFA